MAGGGDSLTGLSHGLWTTVVACSAWLFLAMATSVEAECTFTGYYISSEPRLELTCHCPKRYDFAPNAKDFKFRDRLKIVKEDDDLFPLGGNDDPKYELVTTKRKKKRDALAVSLKLRGHVHNVTQADQGLYVCKVSGRKNEDGPLQHIKLSYSFTLPPTPTQASPTSSPTTKMGIPPDISTSTTTTTNILPSTGRDESFSQTNVYIAVAISCFLLCVVVIAIICYIRVRSRRQRLKVTRGESSDFAYGPEHTANCNLIYKPANRGSDEDHVCIPGNCETCGEKTGRRTDGAVPLLPQARDLSPRRSRDSEEEGDINLRLPAHGRSHYILEQRHLQRRERARDHPSRRFSCPRFGDEDSSYDEEGVFDDGLSPSPHHPLRLLLPTSGRRRGPQPEFEVPQRSLSQQSLYGYSRRQRRARGHRHAGGTLDCAPVHHPQMGYYDDHHGGHAKWRVQDPPHLLSPGGQRQRMRSEEDRRQPGVSVREDNNVAYSDRYYARSDHPDDDHGVVSDRGDPGHHPFGAAPSTPHGPAGHSEMTRDPEVRMLHQGVGHRASFAPSPLPPPPSRSRRGTASDMAMTSEDELMMPVRSPTDGNVKQKRPPPSRRQHPSGSSSLGRRIVRNPSSSAVLHYDTSPTPRRHYDTSPTPQRHYDTSPSPRRHYDASSPSSSNPPRLHYDTSPSPRRHRNDTSPAEPRHHYNTSSVPRNRPRDNQHRSGSGNRHLADHLFGRHNRSHPRLYYMSDGGGESGGYVTYQIPLGHDERRYSHDPRQHQQQHQHQQQQQQQQRRPMGQRSYSQSPGASQYPPSAGRDSYAASQYPPSGPDPSAVFPYPPSGRDTSAALHYPASERESSTDLERRLRRGGRERQEDEDEDEEDEEEEEEGVEEATSRLSAQPPSRGGRGARRRLNLLSESSPSGGGACVGTLPTLATMDPLNVPCGAGFGQGAPPVPVPAPAPRSQDAHTTRRKELTEPRVGDDHPASSRGQREEGPSRGGRREDGSSQEGQLDVGASRGGQREEGSSRGGQFEVGSSRGGQREEESSRGLRRDAGHHRGHHLASYDDTRRKYSPAATTTATTASDTSPDLRPRRPRPHHRRRGADSVSSFSSSLSSDSDNSPTTPSPVTFYAPAAAVAVAAYPTPTHSSGNITHTTPNTISTTSDNTSPAITSRRAGGHQHHPHNQQQHQQHPRAAEINLRDIKTDNETRPKRPFSTTKVKNNSQLNNHQRRNTNNPDDNHPHPLPRDDPRPPVACAADVAGTGLGAGGGGGGGGGGSTPARRDPVCGLQKKESTRSSRSQGGRPRRRERGRAGGEEEEEEEEGGASSSGRWSRIGVDILPSLDNGECSQFTNNNHSTTVKTPYAGQGK